MRIQALFRSSKTLVGSLALLIGLAGTANAASVTVNGALGASDPAMPVVFISTSSPVCNGQGAGLVHYDAVSFTVDASGAYSFSLESPNTFASLYLHTDAFDPAAGLATCLAADGIGTIAFDFGLTAGTNYIAVPFDDTFQQVGGSYALTISGPGNIIVAAVPEPASLMLVGSALLTLLGFRRSRRRAAP